MCSFIFLGTLNLSDKLMLPTYIASGRKKSMQARVVATWLEKSMQAT